MALARASDKTRGDAARLSLSLTATTGLVASAIAEAANSASSGRMARLTWSLPAGSAGDVVRCGMPRLTWSLPASSATQFGSAGGDVGGSEIAGTAGDVVRGGMPNTNTNTNTNTKYTCDTGQTRNKLLAQWVHLTNHAAGHSRPGTAHLTA